MTHDNNNNRHLAGNRTYIDPMLLQRAAFQFPQSAGIAHTHQTHQARHQQTAAYTHHNTHLQNIHHQHMAHGMNLSPVMTPMNPGMSPGMNAGPLTQLQHLPQFQLSQQAGAAFVQPQQMMPNQHQRLNIPPIGTIPGSLPSNIPSAIPTLFGGEKKITFCPGFEGSDVYIANEGVIVGRQEKRYVRIRWGDGQKGHKARWVGFAPSDWKMNRSLATDPQLLGFYVKPNLCDRSNKSKRNSGWVTLSIDCAHRAIKATIDGWTLGKVFIPTWLIGRVMRPVAVAEAGMPVKFDLQTEEGCEKVLRAGFRKWSTITNTPLSKIRCEYSGANFESDVLGMSLDVAFDEEENVAGIRNCGDELTGYISYNAVEAGMVKTDREVIPLVINDRHAFRVKERGFWQLFYADGRVPLDYLSERMTALIRKIYEAKHQNNKRVYKSAVEKLSQFRHILFFLAKNQKVVEDANSRVEWFLSNTCNSGAHLEFTPDLGRLLTCVAVSDYEWEDLAVPFFAEALQRAIPHAMEQNPRVDWSGPDCSLEDIFDSLMTADKSLSEMLLHVMILTKVMKPHHKQLDDIVIERLSAEELCCGIAGLSPELQILEYERSARKDEIKKCLIKREWQHEFSSSQWALIEGVLDCSQRLRGMLNRSRMIAECHGTAGLPTDEMFAAIDSAHELGKTVENFKEYLECYSIAFPGQEAMFSIVKKAVVMATRKGYIESTSTMATYPDEEGLLSARQALTLTPSGSEILMRQGREFKRSDAEVLPSLGNQASNTSTLLSAMSAHTAGATSTAEGEVEHRTTPQPGHTQAGEPHTMQPQTQPTNNYMQFPILVNNATDPAPYLMQSNHGGGAQFQYVQVIPNTVGTQTPGSLHSVHHNNILSPSTTPGSVRIISSATSPAGHFPQNPEAMTLGNPRQLLLKQTPRNPNLPPPPNPKSPEGESYLYGSPTPMGNLAPINQLAQREGGGQYILAYPSNQNNGVMIQV